MALAFVFSMLGLGGAMLYIPVFHGFGYDFKSVAIPTGLLLNGITAHSASIYYLRAKMVDVRGSIPLIISSFIGALVGAYFTRMIPTQTLIVLFAISMLIAGGRMLMVSGQPDKETMMAPNIRVALMGIGGFLIGFIAGHLAEGHYEWPLMAVTTVAVIIGSQIGAKVMNEKMKSRWIKQMFAVVLLVVAAKLLWPMFIAAEPGVADRSVSFDYNNVVVEVSYLFKGVTHE